MRSVVFIASEPPRQPGKIEPEIRADWHIDRIRFRLRQHIESDRRDGGRLNHLLVAL
jgi:hypothetical protein